MPGPYTIIPIDQLDATVAQKGVTDLDEFVGPAGQDGAVPRIDALGVISWDTGFLKAGDDLDLLKGPAGFDGYIPILNSTGDILFTDAYMAPGDQVTELASIPANVGKFLSVDGGGGLVFIDSGASSFVAVTVGASGDFATFGEALDEIAINADAAFGLILVLEQVNWGTTTQTLNKSIIVTGLADDSEIVLNTDDVMQVDTAGGASDGVVQMEFRSLAMTRQSASAGGFDFLHDTLLLMQSVTITDDTTDGAAQGIFDGDAENITGEFINVTIAGTGSTAKIFSRWATANLRFDSSRHLTGIDLLNNITSAELLLQHYTLMNDPGLTSSSLHVRYSSGSLMINDTGGGTITEVCGAASYNKTHDAIAGMDWAVALDNFVGTELKIDEGTYTTTASNVVVGQQAKITGAGRDITTLESSATTGTRVLALQGAESILEDLSLVSTALAATPSRIFEILSGANDCLLRNVRVEMQTDTDVNNNMVYLNADNPRFVDCEFLFSGDAGLQNGFEPQAAVTKMELHRCSFLYTGAAGHTSQTTWVFGNAMPAGSVLHITECFLDMGASTSTQTVFVNMSGVSSIVKIEDNVTQGNLRSLLQDVSLSNSSIQGNQCDLDDGGAATTAAISLTGVIDSVIILGNTFLNCSDRGIDVNSGASAATKVHISDNVITGTGSDGVRLNGDVSQSHVRGNTVDGFTTGLRTATSVGTPDGNQYIGNNFAGCTAAFSIVAGDTSELSLNVEP